MARPTFPQLDRLADYADSDVVLKPQPLNGWFGSRRRWKPGHGRRAQVPVDEVIRSDGRTDVQEDVNDAE